MFLTPESAGADEQKEGGTELRVERRQPGRELRKLFLKLRKNGKVLTPVVYQVN